MDWTRGRIVGRGSTATVSVASALCSGQMLAVKSVEFSRSEFLEREKMILSSLNCPQIVAYKGYDVTTENGKLMCNLFMEYVEGGSIVDAMAAVGGGLNEATVRSFTREILQGLEYLHSEGVVHCDIKCHNVLVAAEGIKIADFGCSRRVEEISETNLAGTPMFMSPEVARGEQQGFPADVWAVGCTVIQMVTGRAPWANISDPVAALYTIGSGDHVPEIPSFMSEQGKDFLRRCLIRNPYERWTANELLKHPFVHDQKSPPPKQNSSRYSETPTSILEQGIWDSVNDSETTHNPIPTQQKNSKTPLQRIQQLIDSSKTQPLGIPNSWEWDENWVTVRNNCIRDDESSHFFLTTKFPCSSESISINKCERDGSSNQDFYSISRSSNYSKKSINVKGRDLSMTPVCIKSVTLETTNFAKNEKSCIIISFMRLISSCSFLKPSLVCQLFLLSFLSQYELCKVKQLMCTNNLSIILLPAQDYNHLPFKFETTAFLIFISLRNDAFLSLVSKENCTRDSNYRKQ